MKHISMKALAKVNAIQPKALFYELLQRSYIKNNDGNWELTEPGKKQDGLYKESKQYGKYIVWTEDLVAANNAQA